MSKTHFSGALFEQVGGVHWVTRPGQIEFYPRNHDYDEQVSCDEKINAEQATVAQEFNAQPLEKNSEHVSGQPSENHLRSSDKTSHSGKDSQQKQDFVSQGAVEDRLLPKSEALASMSLAASKSPQIVVLGAGLDAVWQNEATQAWQLWQNIMLAFGWDDSNMTFFDTTHLVSEEMIFTTMEEVIELGVDWVLTMDDAHPISEQLVEGVQVVSVPDLETMLADPYAKQSFYHAVIELNPLR